MKKALLLLLTSELLSATGCQREGDEVQPSGYDALALETGHWEWESTAYRAGRRTPATEGFTRQLVFGADKQLIIQHGKRFNKKITYALSMGTLANCPAATSTVPIIRYETDSDLPNNDRKTYNIIQTATSQSLVLIGEDACIDAGATETYRWVKE
jgi:glucose/arabinose dehydrogenase